MLPANAALTSVVCPYCNGGMLQVIRTPHGVLERCSACQYFWAEYRTLAAYAADKDNFYAAIHQAQAVHILSIYTCPKCSNRFRQGRAHEAGIVLTLCDSCQALWATFDQLRYIDQPLEQALSLDVDQILHPTALPAMSTGSSVVAFTPAANRPPEGGMAGLIRSVARFFDQLADRISGHTPQKSVESIRKATPSIPQVPMPAIKSSPAPARMPEPIREISPEEPLTLTPAPVEPAPAPVDETPIPESFTEPMGDFSFPDAAPVSELPSLMSEVPENELPLEPATMENAFQSPAEPEQQPIAPVPQPEPMPSPVEPTPVPEAMAPVPEVPIEPTNSPIEEMAPIPKAQPEPEQAPSPETPVETVPPSVTLSAVATPTEPEGLAVDNPRQDSSIAPLSQNDKPVIIVSPSPKKFFWSWARVMNGLPMALFVLGFVMNAFSDSEFDLGTAFLAGLLGWSIGKMVQLVWIYPFKRFEKAAIPDLAVLAQKVCSGRGVPVQLEGDIQTIQMDSKKISVVLVDANGQQVLLSHIRKIEILPRIFGLVQPKDFPKGPLTLEGWYHQNKEPYIEVAKAKSAQSSRQSMVRVLRWATTGIAFLIALLGLLSAGN